jgi:hypothetical protein
MKLRRALFAAVLLALVPAVAGADRRYFLQSYTPYLSPAGETEVEFHAIAGNGRGDSTNTSWGNRFEVEYGITDRVTGALYLNFVQPGGEGAAMKFDGPSLELIGRLADRGKIPLDPALYLEVRESGTELEVEPKLLLAHRRGGLVCVANLIGEFETTHPGGTTSRALRLTGGVSRELGPVVAVGIEALYHHQFESSASNPSMVLLGPTINLQKEKVQLSLAWHPQVWGDPASAGGLDLRDFPRSEVRLLLGLEL